MYTKPMKQEDPTHLHILTPRHGRVRIWTCGVLDWSLNLLYIFLAQCCVMFADSAVTSGYRTSRHSG
ncbi:uncharacterized protein BDZ99DRAFT_457306 [Mytilinidion resinicola]|uniref:Uncharacterized protein n=1 Tax=Mytilinidion resinicola TaxID=574789 RepID=A0A6A6ZA59_9PEZI|nr:uncharacterized protein BDZ99DRAFT_457306 [Mytilinidion resinicola]KAF2817579.1 hypothetical protein BDZ99DRAFT_457306 [Mytilinidion resinicola]